MKNILVTTLILIGIVVAGDIEIGTPDFESLTPFCH